MIDADEVVRELQDHPNVIEEMERILGSPLRNPDGTLDRARAADAAFGDPAKRRALEEYLHPLALRRIDELVGEAVASEGGRRRPRLVVLDVPLLFESGLDRRCDRIVFIESQESDRAARAAAERGWDAGEVARRESHQWSLAEKRARSQHVLRNMGSPAELSAEAARVRREILEALSP